MWDIVRRLVELGTDVRRVECRLYPSLYPEPTTFTIVDSISLNMLDTAAIEPFRPIEEALAALEKSPRIDDEPNGGGDGNEAEATKALVLKFVDVRRRQPLEKVINCKR